MKTYTNHSNVRLHSVRPIIDEKRVYILGDRNSDGGYDISVSYNGSSPYYITSFKTPNIVAEFFDDHCNSGSGGRMRLDRLRRINCGKMGGTHSWTRRRLKEEISRRNHKLKHLLAVIDDSAVEWMEESVYSGTSDLDNDSIVFFPDLFGPEYDPAA